MCVYVRARGNRCRILAANDIFCTRLFHTVNHWLRCGWCRTRPL